MGTAERARVSEGSIEVVKDREEHEVNSGILECHGIQIKEFQEGGGSHLYKTFSSSINNMRNETKALES